MLRRYNIITIAFSLALIATSSFGQSTQNTQPQAEAVEKPASAEPTRQKETDKPLITKIVPVKYLKACEVKELISPFGSGKEGSQIICNDGARGITIKDLPENVAEIEKEIKRLDVPTAETTPAPATSPTTTAGSPSTFEANLNVTVQVVFGTPESVEVKSGTAAPGEVTKILNDLGRNTYANYVSLGPIQRASYLGENSDKAEALKDEMGFEVKAKNSEKSSKGTIAINIAQIQPLGSQQLTSFLIRGLSVKMKGVQEEGSPVIGNADIRTDLRVKDGETVLVYSRTFEGLGLYVLISAKSDK
jgi:type II secretory pathway component GspD/PulD (secretin)